MDKYKTVVKCYQRKKSRQYLITLKGDHGFKGDDPVYIIHEKDLDDFEDIRNSRENLINELKDQVKDQALEHEKEVILKDSKLSQLERDLLEANKKIDELTTSRDEYKNFYEDKDYKLNTAQENFSKALGIVALQNKEITYYRNRPFTHKLLGTIPENIKQIQASEDIYYMEDLEDKSEREGEGENEV